MKEDKIYLQHVLDSIKNIENFIEDIEEKKFIKNILVQSAVIRQLEIIGEAVKKLSTDLKIRYKNIPWKDIAGLRNKLIHDYFGVDINLVWTICIKDIPELKRWVSKIVKKNNR